MALLDKSGSRCLLTYNTQGLLDTFQSLLTNLSIESGKQFIKL